MGYQNDEEALDQELDELTGLLRDNIQAKMDQHGKLDDLEHQANDLRKNHKTASILQYVFRRCSWTIYGTRGKSFGQVLVSKHEIHFCFGRVPSACSHIFLLNKIIQ
jgi:hypothetical protein